MNMDLFQLGDGQRRYRLSHIFLFKKNGEKIISDDEVATASLLCNGAIEARVLGLNRPAMSITGSGAPRHYCLLFRCTPRRVSADIPTRRFAAPRC